MNAYDLADKLQELDSRLHLIDLFKSADMLRQQADRIAHLEMLVANRNEIIDKLDLSPQTKPLSDEEISEIWEGLFENEDDIVHLHNFARAIEERHKIK